MTVLQICWSMSLKIQLKSTVFTFQYILKYWMSFGLHVETITQLNTHHQLLQGNKGNRTLKLE